MTALGSLSADSRDELRAMDRMLERTSGFALAFVIMNHRTLRDALIDKYVIDRGGKILLVELDVVTGESIVRQMERCLDSADVDLPLAMFVRGLENVLELAGMPLQYLEDLNYSRSYCGQRFPFPLVFWTPRYAIYDFMQRAPDLWSCRSDVYDVEGDLDDIRRTVSDLRSSVDELLNSPKRVGEARTLGSLLRALHEELSTENQRFPDREYECNELRAEIEEQLADLAGYTGKLDEREQHLLRTFEITSMRKDLKGDAHRAQKLGQITCQMGRYVDARNHYQHALQWYL